MALPAPGPAMAASHFPSPPPSLQTVRLSNSQNNPSPLPGSSPPGCLLYLTEAWPVLQAGRSPGNTHLPVWGSGPCRPSHPTHAAAALLCPPFYPEQELLSFTRLARPAPLLPGTTSSKDTSPREGFLHAPKKLREIGPGGARTNAASVLTARRRKWAWGRH